MTEEQQPAQEITRRVVTTAAAWSVPVISLAVVAPAAAASQPLLLTATFRRDGSVVILFELTITRNGQPVRFLQVRVRLTYGTTVTREYIASTNESGYVRFTCPKTQTEYPAVEAAGGYITYTTRQTSPLVVDLPPLANIP